MGQGMFWLPALYGLLHALSFYRACDVGMARYAVCWGRGSSVLYSRTCVSHMPSVSYSFLASQKAVFAQLRFLLALWRNNVFAYVQQGGMLNHQQKAAWNWYSQEQGLHCTAGRLCVWLLPYSYFQLSRAGLPWLWYFSKLSCVCHSSTLSKPPAAYKS